MSDRLSSDLAALRIDRDDSAGSTRWIIWLVVVAAVLGIGAAGYFVAYPYVEAKVFKVEVEATQITLVSPAEAQIDLTSTGYVVAQRVSQVGAKIPGRIGTILVKEGDNVEKGQLLAELEDSDLQAGLRVANARVATARAQVATAKANLAEVVLQAKRERGLAERGVSGTAVAEDLEARARALQAQVRAAQANVRAANAEVHSLTVNLKDLKIVAPISGKVTAKPSQAGELVGQMAASIVELADFSSLMVETDVPEGRLHLVKAEGPCEIVLDAFPQKRFRGIVKEIRPKVDRAKATISVKVAFVDDMDQVLPDMSARVSFLQEELDAEKLKEAPKRVVPAAAVTERGGGKVVFTIDDGVVRMKPVTLGAPMGAAFELLEGPAASTKVVRSPADDLFDGQKIKQKGSS